MRALDRAAPKSPAPHHYGTNRGRLDDSGLAGGQAGSCWDMSKDILFPYFEQSALGMIVLAKLTSKNQLTLPKAVTAAVEATEYFDVTTENGRIVLTPVRVNRADGVRAKLAELGLSETDVRDAVAWARTRE